ncbi:MAG: sugar phosphate isomerase/epimerase family protein [Terriglobales bacterium]
MKTEAGLVGRREFLGVGAAAALLPAALSGETVGSQTIVVRDPRYVSHLKLGMFTWPFNDRPLSWVLDYAHGLGLEMLEIGTGNDPGAAHCPVDRLLADGGARRDYRQQFEAHGLGISAFSCHGNPLHPDPAVAKPVHETFVKTLRLAELMDVPVVCYFSGCAGDDRGGQRPNWVTSLETDEYVKLLQWQWERRVIPYWKEAGALARQHGRRVALEFDPGYAVYNVSSLLRVRQAAGESVGCNLDLSNMFAQGVDAVAVIKALAGAGALFHFHAKDAVLDQANIDVNGVLDLTPYNDVLHRSWSYAMVGYGHDTLYWKRTLEALKNAGYDYVLSIEHEDPTTVPAVGVRQSAEFLKEIRMG